MPNPAHRLTCWFTLGTRAHPPHLPTHGPDYDPHGVILALSKGEWVGMAATSLRREESCAVSEMTGVLPGYRAGAFPWR